MRTRLKSKATLFFVACAALLLAVAGTTMALTADPSGTADPSANTSPAPTIQSDKEDYAPGGTVVLTGSNWQPGETVNINVNDDDGQTWNRNVDVVADENGNVRDEFVLPEWFVATYHVTATGDSGAVAKTTFTDAKMNFRANLDSGQEWLVRYEVYSAANCTGTITKQETKKGAGTSGVGDTGEIPTNGSAKLYASDSTVTGSLRTFEKWTEVTSSSNATVKQVFTHGTQNNVTGFTNPNGTGHWICLPKGTPGAEQFFVANYSRNTTTAVTKNPTTNTTYGNSVTFTATVTSSPNPSGVGTVTFKDGATVLCQDVALSGNTASCTTSALTAGSHNITAQYSGTAGTYTIGTTGTAGYGGSTSAARSHTVDKKTVTGSFTAADKEYDGNNSATITSRSLSGKVGSDDVSLTGGTATFNDKNVGTAKTVTGSGFTLSGAAAGNYTLGSVSNTTANITAKPLTVNGITANNKVYDGGTSAQINTTNATLSGVVSSDSDTVTLVTTNASGAFADKNVGTGKTVQISGLSLSGSGASNYSLTQPTTTADIEAKNLTINGAVADSKTYDGNANATVDFANATLDGVVGTEAVTIDPSDYAAEFDTANAGENKPVTVTGVKLGGSDAGNYSVSQPSGLTANIEKAATETTVTCDAGPFTYNGLAQEPCSATVTGPVGLDENVAVTYEDNVNAGTATASATYAESANYNTSSGSQEFEIGKATTTTTVTCDAGPFTYTGSAHTPCQATVEGPGGLDENVAVTYEDNVNAGTATASATYAESANYNTSSGSQEFEIARANITVTADAKSKVQGQPDPPLTYQVTGKPVNGAPISGALTRDAGFESPGTYPIKQGSVDNVNNSNYNITYVGANLTITAAPVAYSGSFLQPINGGLTPAISGMSAADAATAFSNDDSRFKLGSTVPVKFQLKNASGAPVTNAGDIRLFVMQADNKPDPGTSETISTAASTDGNLFRLVDATTGTYMFNLSTKSGYLNPGATTPTAFTSQGTYKLSAVLQDGTSYSVNIQLVK